MNILTLSLISPAISWRHNTAIYLEELGIPSEVGVDRVAYLEWHQMRMKTKGMMTRMKQKRERTRKTREEWKASQMKPSRMRRLKTKTSAETAGAPTRRRRSMKKATQVRLFYLERASKVLAVQHRHPYRPGICRRVSLLLEKMQICRIT